MNIPKETIEQRFRNIFGNGHVSLLLAVQDKTTIYGEKDIYDFVSSELQGIVEELEGMNKQNKVHTKLDSNDDIKSYNYVNHSQNKGYNKALSDAQDIIRRRIDK